ncbi:MAG: hypothetical protein ABI632_07440 [Pseudolysinimonas sp.]
MKKSTLTVGLALPVLVVATLSGCFPGGSGGSATPAPAGLAGCVQGHTWTLDVDDAASQLGAHFQTVGLSVTSVTGTGEQTMKWDADGAIDIETTNLTYDIEISQSASTTIGLKQVHNGPATGTFTIEGTKAVPSDWDASAYTVTTESTVNGVAGPAGAINLPNDELGGVELALTCSGTTLTTLANDGIITWKWTR